MLANLINRTVLYSIKNLPKASTASLEKQGAKTIVDQQSYKKSGLLNMIVHKFKNSNSLFELKRHIQGFEVADFEKQALRKYNQLYKAYNSRNHRAVGEFVDKILAQNFKSQNKKVSKDQDLNLGWHIIADANQAKLMQMRIYQEKMTSVKVSDRWFQMICRFKNPKGEQVYSLLEKHEKNKDFKFKKINL